MPPIKITRAEYEKQFGVPPVLATSTLDNDPIPQRITRAEYNALFRPNDVTFKQDAKRDYLSMGQDINTELQKSTTNRQAIRQRVEMGETSPLKGAFQTLGGGLLTGANVIGQAAVGLARTVLPQSFETRVSETLGEDLAKITAPETRTAFVERLKSSEGGVIAPEFTASLDKKAGKFLQDVGEAYKNDPNFRADVQAAGGVLSWLSAPGVTKKAVEGSLNVAGDIAKATAPVTRSVNEVFGELKTQALRPRNERVVERVANEISDIENNYAKTRNKLDRDPFAVESRARIAQSNVLDGAVDSDGLIRTKQKGGAIEQYKNAPITSDGLTLIDVEDVVKRNLETEAKTVNINELRANMLSAMMDSGLEGADLSAAIRRVDKDLEGLSIRANEFGDVLLSKIQDAKISTTKNIDYTKPVGTTYRKTLARVYKETIEDKSDLPVKEWNQELQKYYRDIDRLADLDGKRVKGGRLGKLTASVTGSAIGAVAGTAGGGTGALLGGILGGEVATGIAGRAMSRTFRQGVDGRMPESSVLAEAQARALSGAKDLKIADRPVGASKAIMADPNMPDAVRTQIVKVESQIKKNVKQQNDAIKKGDFTLVAALKDVYTILVDRLKQLINEYKNMTPGEKQGGFIGQNPFRKENQASDISAPTNAQNISSTVDDVVEDVNVNTVDSATPQTTPLLEEAKKYKSAEEFVKAQGGVGDSIAKAMQKEFELEKLTDELSKKANSFAGKGGIVTDKSPEYLQIKTELDNAMREYTAFKKSELGKIVQQERKKLPLQVRMKMLKGDIKTKAQLEDIWKQANNKTGSTSLLEEAKPYFADPRKIPKTEDEFINAHRLYHGANLEFADKLEKTRKFNPGAKREAGTGGNFYGLSATTDFAMAKDFSTSVTGKGRVVELYIDPKARVLNMKGKALDDLTESETRKLAKDYDIIRDFDNVGGENEVRVLNPDVLRDRSQIESAWVLQDTGITNYYK